MIPATFPPPAQVHDDSSSEDTHGDDPLYYHPSVTIPKLVFETDQVLHSGDIADVDFIRAVVVLSPQFYEHETLELVEMFEKEDQYPETDEELDAMKTNSRFHLFSKHIANEDFVKLFGCASHTKGYGNSSSFHSLKRRFSVIKNDWRTKFPYCPEDMAGNEYCLIRSPVEIAIPGAFVLNVVQVMQDLGHHIGVRTDWETSHIVVNDATTMNNPPCLRDWIKAIAYCGVTYVVFVSHGQRWPIKFGNQAGLEGAEYHFWDWYESINSNDFLHTRNCSIAVPMIHTGVTFKGGKYPCA